MWNHLCITSNHDSHIRSNSRISSIFMVIRFISQNISVAPMCNDIITVEAQQKQCLTLLALVQGTAATFHDRLLVHLSNR